MSWLQISVSADKSKIAAIESHFEQLGALSVTYGDACGQDLLEPAPGETRLWNSTRITALFEGERDPAELRDALQRTLEPEAFASLEQEVLQDQVWERAWMDHFHPMLFGRRLWVCPDGQRPEEQAQDSVFMDLDPGLAFGSGTHPTTSLCLQWIDGADLNHKSVLDYGCGSGILAIAAALLGARSVAAVDYDPQALEATADNAGKNAVKDRIKALAPQQCPNQGFDLLLANILAGTLVELAPTLTPRVAPGGDLVMSGILQEQAQQVIDAYQDDFILSPPLQQQEWLLIHGKKKAAC